MMIPLSKDVAQAMPGIMGIVVALIGWIVAKRTVNKARADYFAKYGRYPGEPAAKHEPAE